MCTKIRINNIIAVFFLAIIVFIALPARAEIKKVVLFPLELHGDESKGYLRQGLRSIFLSRISDKEIEIIDDEKISSLMGEDYQNGVSSQKKAEELARLLDADYAMFGSITVLGESYSIDLGILDLTKDQAEPIWIPRTATEDQLINRIDEMAKESRMIIGGKAVPKRPSLETAVVDVEEKKPSESFLMEPDGKLNVRMEVMASDSGDLNGDGRTELVILGRERILIYSKEGDKFALKDNLKPSFGTWFLKVSVGDVDRNGMEELCVVSLDGGRAQSTVWEWKGEFKRLYKHKGHLRITDDKDNKRSVILFQNSSPQEDKFFLGDIWVMGLDDKGRPVKQRSLNLPKGAQFYTIVFIDLEGDGKQETLSLGWVNIRERGELILCNTAGEVLWKSAETFGGTNNLVRIEYSESVKGEVRIPLNFRPVLIDSNRDGKNDEVIVVRNSSKADLVKNLLYEKSKFTILKIDVKGLSYFWTSHENGYSPVDMHAEGGALFVATHEPRITNFSKESGRIIWFER